jgi:hypothetical protein
MRKPGKVNGNELQEAIDGVEFTKGKDTNLGRVVSRARCRTFARQVELSCFHLPF